MEGMLVAIFDDEVNAQAASKSLQRMSDDGVIAVHTVRLFRRERNGSITSDDVYDSLPEGTMGATTVGGLLGLLGGPIGLAIGAAGGMLIGAMADYAKKRVTADFAQHVADELIPGRTAIVAEVYEESTEAVDARLHKLGATISREDLSDVADREYDHVKAAIKGGLVDTEAKLAAKRASRKAWLHATIDPLTKKIEDTLTRD